MHLNIHNSNQLFLSSIQNVNYDQWFKHRYQNSDLQKIIYSKNNVLGKVLDVLGCLLHFFFNALVTTFNLTCRGNI